MNDNLLENPSNTMQAFLAAHGIDPYGPSAGCWWLPDDSPDAACVEQLRKDLERERLRLTACGVVAMSNTRESAQEARKMAAEYRSASCDDVARAVDSEMALREALEEILAVPGVAALVGPVLVGIVARRR